MRILEIRIDGYKNLMDFKVQFNPEYPISLLIGANGCGKSNLLEAISAIFKACYNNEDNVLPSFSFDLKYEIEVPQGSCLEARDNEYSTCVHICNNDGKVKVYYNNADGEPALLDSKRVVSFLPKNIVAIYSGEEKRLWNNYFYTAYDNFNKQYIKNDSKMEQQRLVYINKYYWDLMALVLLISDLPSHQEFLSEEVGIFSPQYVHCEFDLSKVEGNKNIVAQKILEIINPEKKGSVDVDLETFSILKDAIGYEKEIFYNLAVLILYKEYKIITKFQLVYRDGMIIQNLSEGEKKLLLIYGATNLLAEQNSIILFDEPDAHLHEKRKEYLYEKIKSSLYKSCVAIISTHSPTFATCAKKEELISITIDNGNPKVIPAEKAAILRQLTGETWSAIEQNHLFNAGNPLLLVEGNGDVAYIKKAIELFSEHDKKYSKLKLFDILDSGGASNMPEFVNELRRCIPETKKIVVMLDRDDAGGDALKKIINNGKDKRDMKTYHKDNFYYFKLPETLDYPADNFVIEDYFSIDIKRGIAQAKLDNLAGNFNSYPKDFKQHIKDELAKDIEGYNFETMYGFKTLLDKLLAIINGEEVLTEL